MDFLHTRPNREVEVRVTAAQIGKRSERPDCGGTFTLPTRVRDNPSPERPARGRKGRQPDPATGGRV